MCNICKENELVIELISEIKRLIQENLELKMNNKLLHNSIEQKYEENNEGGYTEQEFDALAKAYADFGY